MITIISILATITMAGLAFLIASREAQAERKTAMKAIPVQVKARKSIRSRRLY
jgi:hypothetical protein